MSDLRSPRGFGFAQEDLDHVLSTMSYAEIVAILADNGLRFVELEVLLDWFCDGERRRVSDPADLGPPAHCEVEIVDDPGVLEIIALEEQSRVRIVALLETAASMPERRGRAPVASARYSVRQPGR